MSHARAGRRQRTMDGWETTLKPRWLVPLCLTLTIGKWTGSDGSLDHVQAFSHHHLEEVK
jgi:hypothetical protein